MTNKENVINNYDSIDISRIFAALFVVCIHTSSFINNELYNLIFINVICRYAVPFFYIASGFFFFKKIEFTNHRIKKCKKNFEIFLIYEKRIIILYVIWSAVYGLVKYYSFCKTAPNEYNFFKDFLVSCVIGDSYYHMWYLLSMIFAIPLAYFLLRFVGIKITVIISGALYLLGSLAYAYSWLPIISNLANILDKTKTIGIAFDRALPLIIVGLICFLYKHKNKRLTIIMLALCILLNLIEIMFLYLHCGTSLKSSYVITTIPLAYFIFTCLQNIKIDISQKVCIYFRKMSTIIYCVHPLIIFILTELNINLGFTSFILILSISLLIASMTVYLSKFKYLRWLKYIS